jgi:hypothetical protein
MSFFIFIFVLSLNHNQNSIIMRLSNEALMEKLKALSLIDENGNPISFSKFKKLVDIHQFGSGSKRLFIFFIGNPKENLIGFYPPTDARPEMMKICYQYLVDTITTDIKQEYLDGNIQWGNCGIPIGYGDLRAHLPSNNS